MLTADRKSLDSEEDDDDDTGASYGHVADNFFQKSPWTQDHDHLLFFGSPTTNLRLFTLHPEQVHIFRLWQIYLENVNPLLKVTHTPTLQARIIDAIGDLTSMQPAFQALVFSIYCVAVMSLSENESNLLFGTPRETLLSRYHFACQQALRNCSVLSSDDPGGLTAFYLYLVCRGRFLLTVHGPCYIEISHLTSRFIGVCQGPDQPTVPVLHPCRHHPHRKAQEDAR